jgi:Short C-terminal domain
MWAFALLAQAGRDKDPFRQPEVIWGTAGLAVALLVGALVVWSVDRWRKRASASGVSADELTDFRGMYERGEITEEEYNKLRARVAQRVRPPAAPAGSPPGPAAPPTPPTNPGNPPNPPPPA